MKSNIQFISLGLLIVFVAACSTRVRVTTKKPAVLVEIEMIYVKGGTFTMGCTSEQGSDCNYREKPAHRVTVSNFYIGKYEVTQAQWEAAMGSNPSKFKGDNLPVECVSWDDIQEFIRKLNEQSGKRYRLPTEAEWEYAARGGTQSKGYKYSGSNTTGSVAWYYDNSGNKTCIRMEDPAYFIVWFREEYSDNKTHPVGARQANELGIYDMSGNVREWCSDWDGVYSSSAQTNPRGPSSGSNRVHRGGSWYGNAEDVRVSNRSYNTPGRRSNDLGFRLALSSK